MSDCILSDSSQSSFSVKLHLSMFWVIAKAGFSWMQNFVPWKDKIWHIVLTQDQRSSLGFAPKLLLVVTAGIKSPACCSFPVFLGCAASCVVCGCLKAKAPARQSSALGSLQPVCIGSIVFLKSGDRCSPLTSSHREYLIVLGSFTACARKSLALEFSVCGSFCSCLQAEVKESEN